MKTAYRQFQNVLDQLKQEGLYKEEQQIRTRQGSKIETVEGGGCLNFCANNYLGLAGSEELVEAAKEGLDRWGYGLSSVRFICGTQEVHKQLEKSLAAFFGMEDAILYSSCFDANGGIFECLLKDDCAVISDELNHASIIDGVRLCQGEKIPVQKQQHGGAGKMPAGGAGCPDPFDCHRWRILHGWNPGGSAGDLPAGGSV